MRCALSFTELLRLVEFNLFIISIIQQTPWFEPRRSNVKKCWTLKDEIHSLTSVKFYRCLYNLDLYTVPCKNGICTPWAFCVWPTQNSVKLVTNDNIHPSIHPLSTAAYLSRVTVGLAPISSSHWGRKGTSHSSVHHRDPQGKQPHTDIHAYTSKGSLQKLTPVSLNSLWVSIWTQNPKQRGFWLHHAQNLLILQSISEGKWLHWILFQSVRVKRAG